MAIKEKMITAEKLSYTLGVAWKKPVNRADQVP